MLIASNVAAILSVRDDTASHRTQPVTSADTIAKSASMPSPRSSGGGEMDKRKQGQQSGNQCGNEFRNTCRRSSQIPGKTGQKDHGREYCRSVQDSDPPSSQFGLREPFIRKRADRGIAQGIMPSAGLEMPPYTVGTHLSVHFLQALNFRRLKDPRFRHRTDCMNVSGRPIFGVSVHSDTIILLLHRHRIRQGRTQSRLSNETVN